MVGYDVVSIHAFREGRRQEATKIAVFFAVSIHAFREGRRQPVYQILRQINEFQSTPSAREGDDCPFRKVRHVPGFQSTPSAREGDYVYYANTDGYIVSFNPRLPRGKATVTTIVRLGTQHRFNPRLPRGKATASSASASADGLVSIHAFREGRRQPLELFFLSGTRVSIHAFREGRRLVKGRCVVVHDGVSIHAFREGRRRSGSQLTPTHLCFNPRLPRGKATLMSANIETGKVVSIHAFREGRRRNIDGVRLAILFVSIHAFREGRRQ